MSTRFTSGPWSTAGVFIYHSAVDRKNVWGPTDHASGDQSGELICQKATIANAALIADAPAMYEFIAGLVSRNALLQEQDHQAAKALLARHQS